MKAKGFNGREYTWNLSKYDVYNDDNKRRSKHHLRARRIIRELYSSYRILEEVKLPGSTASHKRSVLYLDFFIPVIKIGLEVHGRQHYDHIPFFHKTKKDFLLSQARDEDKHDWCELNGIKLVVLKYSDNDDEWRSKIKGV